jgi:hypothetical protein
MLEHPTGMRRALATFSIPDDLTVFDFDDASNLQHVEMRPSQVIIRNKTFTQSKAAALFSETSLDGARRWSGVSWSFHRPTWHNLVLWATETEPAHLTLHNVDELSLTSPAITAAARALYRPLAKHEAPAKDEIPRRRHR